jgi:hypothetical protein
MLPFWLMVGYSTLAASHTTTAATAKMIAVPSTSAQLILSGAS